MSNEEVEGMKPLPVHVVNQAPAIEEPQWVYNTVYGIVTLTPTDAHKQLLPASSVGHRVQAWAQALDDDACLSGNESDAKKNSGTIVPAKNTTPYPINDSGAVFVAVSTFAGATSRITFSATYRTRA